MDRSSFPSLSGRTSPYAGKPRIHADPYRQAAIRPEYVEGSSPGAYQAFRSGTAWWQYWPGSRASGCVRFESEQEVGGIGQACWSSYCFLECLGTRSMDGQSSQGESQIQIIGERGSLSHIRAKLCYISMRREALFLSLRMRTKTH